MSLDFERGRAAERNRFYAILSSPEAKGQLEFAVHLALNTDMAAPNALAALRQGLPDGYSPAEVAAMVNSLGQFASAANFSELSMTPNQKGAVPWTEITEKLNTGRG